MLGLFKSLLKESRKMSDYNFRSYAVRRTRQGFREGKYVSPDLATQLYESGISQLAMLHRQQIISNLFPGVESVMSANTIFNTDAGTSKR